MNVPSEAVSCCYGFDVHELYRAQAARAVGIEPRTAEAEVVLARAMLAILLA